MLSTLMQQIVFFVFASILVVSAAMVILSKNTVRAALFLVLSFFVSAVLWMLMQAEFLSLALIFVYVGAVMTLFLFVVMMLDLDEGVLHEGFVRYLPFGFIIMVMLIALIMVVIMPRHFVLSGHIEPQLQPADYSNTKALGMVLYTQYMFPFEIAGVILLVAMISAISLAFRGPRQRRKQDVASQVAVKAKDRIRIVKMKTEKS